MFKLTTEMYLQGCRLNLGEKRSGNGTRKRVSDLLQLNHAGAKERYHKGEVTQGRLGIATIIVGGLGNIGAARAVADG